MVVLGDIPATGHIPDACAVRGPALTSLDEAAPGFLDLVSGNLSASSDGILVLYPRWQAEPAKRLIRLTRGLLETDQVASVGLDLPPLACSVVGDLLSLAVPHLDVGRLAGLADRLRNEVLSGARVASVAKLEHIDTKLIQHMASYSPGSEFLAWATPEGRIDRVSRRRPLTPPRFRPAGPVRLLVAPHGTDFPEFEKELATSLRPDWLDKVPAQPLGSAFWGTRKHVEFVAFSAHPQVLSDIVRSTRYWTCRWCKQPTALDICAICGMFQEAEATVSARVPETVAAPASGSARTPGVSPEALDPGVSADQRTALPAPPVFMTAPPYVAAQAVPRMPAAPVAQALRGAHAQGAQVPRRTPATQDPWSAEATRAPAAPKRTTPGQPQPGQPQPGQTEPVQAAPRQAAPVQVAPKAASHQSAGGPAGSPGPRTAASIPQPGPSRGRDDDRATPFGKGAPGTEPAANGARPPEHEHTTQARPAGSAAPAQQDQHDQQMQSQHPDRHRMP